MADIVDTGLGRVETVQTPCGFTWSGKEAGPNPRPGKARPSRVDWI